jgi:hypothetical protein
VSFAQLLVLSINRPVFADPARIWISSSSSVPGGPAAATIQAVNGGINQVYIWAQPATVGAGAYSPSNPFKRLQNLSLNLVSKPGEAASVDFLDDLIVVHNPVFTTTAKRFEFVNDVSSAPPLVSEKTEAEVLSGMSDGIQNMQGYTISEGSGLGIGPTCHASDAFYCAATPSGAPAWLLATVGFRTVSSSGAAPFFLQIGRDGMNHFNEHSALTTVLLGADSAPEYDAYLNRRITLSGDTPDLVVQIVSTRKGDFNQDGVVDAADYVVWRKGLTSGAYTLADYQLWRANFGTMSGGGLSLFESVPEPAAIHLLMGILPVNWLFTRCRRT